MSDITLPEGSPFDALRRQDDRGEWWSARNLMKPLGYSQWRSFADAVDRARAALRANDQDPDAHAENFAEVRKVSRGPAAEDYRLSREGAYAVVQSCDARKPEVAAAHGYFRDRTIRYEQADERLRGILADRGTVLELAREVVALDEILTVRVEELKVASERLAIEAPKVAVYDAVMDTRGWYSLAVTAQMINLDGKGRQTMVDALRASGVFCAKVPGEGPRPRQEFMNKGLFDVRLVARPNGSGEDLVTFVSPRGVEWICDRLLKMGLDVGMA